MRWFRLYDAAGTDIYMDGPEAFGHALREPPPQPEAPALLRHIRQSPPRSLTRPGFPEPRARRPRRKAG